MMTSDDVEHEDAVAGAERALLDRAGPQLYRENVFRLTGLPVDATATTVRRRRQDMKMADALGAAGTAGGRFPLLPPPDGKAVRSAFEDLKDPVRRLHDELFWFWLPPDATDGGTLDHRHDQAVAAHLVALDIECGPQPPPPDQVAVRDAAWQQAMLGWAALAPDPALWARLRDRVAELAEPRLTTGTVRRLRHGVGLEVLMTSVRTVIDASSDEVGARHRWLQDGSPFPAELVEQARRECLQPSLRGVERAVEDAWAASNRVRAAQAARDVLRRLQVETDPLLSTIARVLGSEHRTTRSLRDEIALVTIGVGVTIHNLPGTDAWPTSPEAVREAIAIQGSAARLATRETTISRVDDQVAVAARNLVDRALDPELRAGKAQAAADVLRAWRRFGDVPPVLAEIDRRLAPGGLIADITTAPRTVVLWFIGVVRITGRGLPDGRYTTLTWFLALLPLLPLSAYVTERRADGVWFLGTTQLDRVTRWWRRIVLFAVLVVLLDALLLDAAVPDGDAGSTWLAAVAMGAVAALTAAALRQVRLLVRVLRSPAINPVLDSEPFDTGLPLREPGPLGRLVETVDGGPGLPAAVRNLRVGAVVVVLLAIAAGLLVLIGVTLLG